MQNTRPDDRHRVLTALREAIQSIERRPARRGGVVPCGLPGIDAALPDGGFPRGAISELSGGRASGKTAVALAALASMGSEELFAWVDGRGELYPPAAAARGIDLERLLIVRPTSGGEAPLRTGLWAAEVLLGSTAFAAVVLDLPLRRVERGWEAMAHRVQSAAEKGGGLGLWLTSPRSPVRVPAALRLELSIEGDRVAARRILGGVAMERRGHVA